MVRKTIDLSEEKEPDIFGAIKGPAGLLENVAVDDLFRPDYSDTSKTANGRARRHLEEGALVMVLLVVGVLLLVVIGSEAV